MHKKTIMLITLLLILVSTVFPGCVKYGNIKGKTSYDANHEHEFVVDLDGNGWTSVDEFHRHKIVDFVVQEKDIHIHTLLGVSENAE